MRATARRLWDRRGVRRFAFCAGLVLEMALVGFAIGLTLPNGTTPPAVKHRTQIASAHHPVKLDDPENV